MKSSFNPDQFQNGKYRIYCHNWYRKSMALEPGMWQSDPNAHRLRQHQDVVRTPFGYAVRQKQDQNELSSLYNGVHLTDSFDNASIYANNKSTQEDFPVVIEIYKDGLEAQTDVDAEEARQSFFYILSEKKSEIDAILFDQSLDSETKAEKIISIFETGLEYGDHDGSSQDPIDYISEQQRTPVERVIVSYLDGIPDSDTKLSSLSELMNGNIPDSLLIEAINQFRVTSPIESTRVRAIYRIPRVNLEEFKSFYLLSEMDDEELEEEGIIRVGGEFFDDDMRLLVDYEDLDNSPFEFNKRVIYESSNDHQVDTTYHGTTYSRAKSAFPDLLQ